MLTRVGFLGEIYFSRIRYLPPPQIVPRWPDDDARDMPIRILCPFYNHLRRSRPPCDDGHGGGDAVGMTAKIINGKPLTIGCRRRGRWGMESDVSGWYRGAATKRDSVYRIPVTPWPAVFSMPDQERACRQNNAVLYWAVWPLTSKPGAGGNVNRRF